MGKGGGSSVDTRVAKTAPATSFEDETVKLAGDNTRRRIRAANSRDAANSATGGATSGIICSTPIPTEYVFTSVRGK